MFLQMIIKENGNEDTIGFEPISKVCTFALPF